MQRQILAITRKELNSYFGSPLAFIFIGTFLAAVLFIFFTIETFFARSIADVRPLFRWMPVLLIFLIAALTMRQWSEERRSGTQELLLTLPVSPVALVLGKFLAVLTLIALALVLTLPLPVTVALIGSLDWGPVFGGYLAALLVAAAYAAIGLFISSRTDNQIVALILTVLVSGFFYLLGTRGVTGLFNGGATSEILWALGTGSRFESIERGVIDLRDLVYYLSLTIIFLALNVVSLDAVRWSARQQSRRRRALLTAALIGLNLILLNVWLFPLQGLRLDLTQQREYSLSATTEDLFASIQEPLLIRAYISERTHPLLAPLIPQIRDMLREYEIASDGRITAEVVDPLQYPEIEAEANQTYGIQPTPFSVSDRREASVINSYFDILVRYGDQTTILNFQDLIQVNAGTGGTADVRLRNMEYDLTSAIKKVIFGFQSVDALLAAMDEPVRLTLYVTPETLPETLAGVEEGISNVAEEIADQSDGKFLYEVVNLNAADSPVAPDYLLQTYGLQPIPTSFFATDSFYAHMILEGPEQLQILYPPEDLSEGSIRSEIETALRRTSSDFLQVVGVYTPVPPPQDPSLLGVPQPLSDYNLIQEQLRQSYSVQPVDLSTGQVPQNVDVLLVVTSQDLTEQELYAVDQSLMRGGAVVLATNKHQIAADNVTGGLAMLPAASPNLDAWLEHVGVSLSDSLVLDPQNQPFPVTVARDVGDFQVQEIQAVDYPYFIDVRPDSMDTSNPILANLPAVTVNWASPVTLDEAKNEARETSILLRSSDRSWLAGDANIQPDFGLYPELGFPVGAEQQSHPLAVALQGQFRSYFEDRPLPFEQDEASGTADPGEAVPTATPPLVSTINVSPDSSRLVVIGSNAFVEDFVLNLSSALTQDRYLANLQFLQNTVDWSAEDLDLLAIRSRGTVSRVLDPMTENEQSVWEIGNYVVALAALIAIFIAWRVRGGSERPMELTPKMEG
jgi:ABC-2 type transport system permease protein